MPEIPQRGQRNDCTVVALSILTGLEYAVVESVLSIYNRRHNCGFHLYRWLEEHNGYVLGHHFQPCYRTEPHGKFLLGNNGHVAAFVDGKLIHRLSSGMRYSRVFAVTVATTPDETKAALEHAQFLALI